MEEGADINIVDRWGKTPLHLAVIKGNIQAAAMLSKQGAKLKVTNPAGEMCSAASSEDIEQVIAHHQSFAILLMVMHIISCCEKNRSDKI